MGLRFRELDMYLRDFGFREALVSGHYPLVLEDPGLRESMGSHGAELGVFERCEDHKTVFPWQGERFFFLETGEIDAEGYRGEAVRFAGLHGGLLMLFESFGYALGAGVSHGAAGFQHTEVGYLEWTVPVIHERVENATLPRLWVPVRDVLDRLILFQ